MPWPRESTVPGARNGVIRKCDHGEKRRAQWRELRLVVSKCGGKYPIILMRISLLNCAREWRRISKYARTVPRYSTECRMSWAWSPMAGCFKRPRGLISACTTRLIRTGNLVLTRLNLPRPKRIGNVLVVHVQP